MIRLVKVEGAEDLTHKLDRMLVQLSDFTEPLDEAGEYWRDQVDMQFALRGALPGVRGPWKPLAPVTVEAKGSTRPLIESGNMELSYINPWEPYNIERVGGERATFGSRYMRINRSHDLVPIAVYHQMGTRFMPARPIVLGNRFLDREIGDSFVEHIFRGWRL